MWAKIQLHFRHALIKRPQTRPEEAAVAARFSQVFQSYDAFDAPFVDALPRRALLYPVPGAAFYNDLTEYGSRAGSAGPLGQSRNRTGVFGALGALGAPV